MESSRDFGVAPTASVPPSDGAAAKQVFFHVGAPKTGTTFLQQVLWHNRVALGRDGVCYPLDHPTAHFTATLDLCQRRWGGRWDPSWDGSWDRVAERIRQWPGDRAVFSAEIMGLVTPEQAQRAIESVQPAEVHVVFTARDLARQLPSDWQEQIKHRHTVTLTKFVEDLVRLGHRAPKPFGEMFWGLHDPVYVLGKWEDLVPRENIHVVTVPPPTARQDLLWRRFAGVIGIDADAYSLNVPRDNTAMGVVETEFLRRFNTTAGKRLTHEHGPIINNLVGQRLLASREGKQSIRMPRQYNDWVSERSEQIIDQLGTSGYEIVGDLGELRPVPPPPDEPIVTPEEIEALEVAAVANDLVAGLVEEVLSLRGQVRLLKDRLTTTQQARPGKRMGGAGGRSGVDPAALHRGGPPDRLRPRPAAAKKAARRARQAGTPGADERPNRSDQHDAD